MDFLTFYNITIAPTGMTADAALTYTRQVTIVLDWIQRTTAGKTLLNSIRFHGRTLTISPWTGTGCNSSGGGTGTPRVGIVSYSPDIYVHGACSAQRTEGNTAAFTRDAVLFHELVHVLRSVSGKWTKGGTTGGLFFYDNIEEFYAVMVANIYISDSTNPIKSGLRGDHVSHSGLEPDFAKPFEFFSAGTQVAPLVKKFILENHGFSVRLANDVKARFNPIADYIADSDRCDELSKKARAIDRGRIDTRFPLMGKLLDLLGK